MRAVLVARDRGVALDHRALGDRGNAVEPEHHRDRALVHRAVARQRRVLLVQGEHAARQPLVLERLAQAPGVDDRDSRRR